MADCHSSIASSSAPASASPSGSSSPSSQQSTSESPFANRLATEKSPYLLQHKHNPVDWYPWGEEAFQTAVEQNKPIFLSVGYSTCHWCHVMEHESFEDPSTAALMNENFVNIKVDREERPDVDKCYMSFVQALTKRGGWPMSVFLTPDLKPFMGGTYFPPRESYGQPSFKRVLGICASRWQTQQADIQKTADQVAESLQEESLPSLVPEALPGTSSEGTKAMCETCYKQIASSYDADLGGFGDAPKFPRPVVLNFLFHHYALENSDIEERKNARFMALHTLRAMASGGMHDHLAGGFHRYSVTEDWHIPHYEKMLYDQAQLARSYLEAVQLSGEAVYERVARDICEYVCSPRMRDPAGGFYCAEDADSLPPLTGATKKLEGAFYVWREEEIRELLGERADLFCRYFDVRPEGNTPHGVDPHGDLDQQNTLIARRPLAEVADSFHLSVEAAEAELSACRKILNEVREKRPHPHLDDKILVAWNGMMISSLCLAHRVLREPQYLEYAITATNFVFNQLYSQEAGLIRSYREGPSAIPAFCADYASLIGALLELYASTFDTEWLRRAVELQEKQLDLFWDDQMAGFFNAPANDPRLLFRSKEAYDGAEPSENSISAANLVRLALLLDHSRYRGLAERMIKTFAVQLAKAPITVPEMVNAARLLSLPPMHTVLVLGEDLSLQAEQAQAFVRALWSRFLPQNQLVCLHDQRSRTFFAQYTDRYAHMDWTSATPATPAATGSASSSSSASTAVRAYVCRDLSCERPTNDLHEFTSLLDQISSSPYPDEP